MNNNKDFFLSVKNGDPKALSEMVLNYKNYIYTAIVRNNIYGEEADEVFQDIFLKIFKNIEKYNLQYDFKNWIFTIALNHIRNIKKKERNDSKYKGASFDDMFEDSTQYKISATTNNRSAGMVSASFKNGETLLLDKERETEVNQALSKLSDNYFKVIFFFYYENLDIQSISKRMNTNSNTVKTLMRRAKEKLSEYLKLYQSDFV